MTTPNKNLPARLLTDAPPDRRERSVLRALCLLSVAAGLVYALAIRPGTPYDEPSHFSTVQHYARFAGMPVLGKPGVSYGGYQPPAYYFIGALLYRILRVVGAGQEAAFYALRVAGLTLLLPMVHFSYRLTRHALPQRGTGAYVVALFVGLNPSLLAIAASVQNDMLAITLCT